MKCALSLATMTVYWCCFKKACRAVKVSAMLGSLGLPMMPMVLKGVCIAG